MHHLVRAEDIRPVPAFPGESRGYGRQTLIDHSVGAVHTGVAMCTLEAGGHVNTHVQSYEESFYVLEGAPRLVLDGALSTLAPGACGVIPVGMEHAWLGPESGTARWIEAACPCPRGENFADDTYFIGPPAPREDRGFDIRDPRFRHLFRVSDDDIDVDRLKAGMPSDAPKVSASMATALLVYSGISVKMLVDSRLDAALMQMFLVHYQPGGVALPHDHPLEEAYCFLEGEVEAEADGKRYLLRPGDVFWTGVGAVHAFWNRTEDTVLWLETQSPQPPARHSYRFARDWDYLRERLAAEHSRAAE